MSSRLSSQAKLDAKKRNEEALDAELAANAELDFVHNHYKPETEKEMQEAVAHAVAEQVWCARRGWHGFGVNI